MLNAVDHVDLIVSESDKLNNNESNVEVEDNAPVLNENITSDDEIIIAVALSNSEASTKHGMLIEMQRLLSVACSESVTNKIHEKKMRCKTECARNYLATAKERFFQAAYEKRRLF